MEDRASTLLARKLGLGPRQAVAFVGLPDGLAKLARAAEFRRIELAPDWRALPEGARDVIHMFATDVAQMRAALPVLQDLIAPAGAIWIHLRKTDMSAETIRAAAPPDMTVEARVRATDAVWSCVKLVVRAEAQVGHINSGVLA
jgi:hypothetical protein